MVMAPAVPRSWNTVFHRLVGVVYVLAFYSIYMQFRGLYGYNGLLPVHDFATSIRAHFDRNRKDAPLLTVLVRNFPALPVYGPELGVSADGLAEFMLCLGLMSSALVALSASPSAALLGTSWLCYLGILLMGQTFMTFQWDILLLEVGFLCIFATSQSRAKDAMMNWAFRFLVFKLMFSSGVVKLQARCPTWEQLTALEYHFATQPIANPLAWLAHQLPPVLLRFGVAATLMIEIPLALCLVSPLLLVRRTGAVLQAMLQLLIVATGNYNFFNALTALLMVPVWASDDDNGNDLEHDWSFKPYFSLLRAVNDTVWGNVLQFAGFLAFTITSALWMFRWVPAPDDVPWWAGSQLSVAATWPTLQKTMFPCCAAALVVCVVHASLHGLNLMLESMQTVFSEGTRVPRLLRVPVALGRMCGDAVYLCVTVSWVFLAAVPLAPIADMSSVIPSHAQVMHQQTQGYHLVSGYGLFRTMTGRGPTPSTRGPGGFVPSVVARPEVVLEGLQGSTNRWLEIHFRAKPTDLYQMPPQVAPHQPRLDWQAWFAALGAYGHNPWFVHLAWKLLQMDPSQDVDAGNGQMRTVPATAYAYPEVLALLDVERYPFKLGDPPRAIRAQLYEYDFTRVDAPWTRVQPHAVILNMTLHGAWDTGVRHVHAFLVNGTVPPTHTHQWWSRRGPKEYMPAIGRGDQSIPTMLKNAVGIEDRPRQTQRALYHDCMKQGDAGTLQLPAGSPWQPAVAAARGAVCSTLLLNEHGTATWGNVALAVLPRAVTDAVGLPAVALTADLAQSLEVVAVTIAGAYALGRMFLG